MKNKQPVEFSSNSGLDLLFSTALAQQDPPLPHGFDLNELPPDDNQPAGLNAEVNEPLPPPVLVNVPNPQGPVGAGGPPALNVDLNEPLPPPAFVYDPNPQGGAPVAVGRGHGGMAGGAPVAVVRGHGGRAGAGRGHGGMAGGAPVAVGRGHGGRAGEAPEAVGRGRRGRAGAGRGRHGRAGVGRGRAGRAGGAPRGRGPRVLHLPIVPPVQRVHGLIAGLPAVADLPVFQAIERARAIGRARTQQQQNR